MTARWLETEDGQWLNADLAATAQRCVAAGGTPRWQFFTAERKSLGVVATRSIRQLLMPSVRGDDASSATNSNDRA
jgi:hypothetical protein